MPASQEYLEFLREEQEIKKRNWYERFSNFSEKILPINPWKSLKENYEDSINFAHLNTTARGAFAATLLSTLLVVLIPSIISLLFGLFSLSTLLLIFVFGALTFYYFYELPIRRAIVFRIKASAEMVLAVTYMVTAMRISSNIENAIQFASKSLTGPLAYDLRTLLWNVYTRRYDSISNAVDDFIRKWKKENDEFTQAIYLIKTASTESAERMESVLDEAVSVVLNGTKERMKRYAEELKTPVTALNSLGILLPIIGLVFFPIMSIFLPDIIQPLFLGISYVVFLPIVVYLLMRSYLDKRPYTFHQPDLSLHPKFARMKILNKNFFISLAVALILISIGTYGVFTDTSAFDFNALGFSTLITIGISSGIILYTFLDSREKLKVRNEVVQIENEFAEALFQLGNQLKVGIPIESALKQTLPRIQELKISKFFQVIVYNIETFGMTFEAAIFDEKSGAIHQYPSRLIAAISRALVDVSARGMGMVSKTMLSVSTYLKDVESVENDLREMLSETTSTMQIQSELLAPISAGVVVALTAVVMQMLIVLKEAISKVEAQITSYGGPAGPAGGFIFGNLIQLNKTIPVQQFQLIVGLYMIEVVGLLSFFLSIINNGDEQILRNSTIGKQLLLSTAIYSLVSLFIYLGFSSLIPLSGFGTG